jgi:hypothetical protein
MDENILINVTIGNSFLCEYHSCKKDYNWEAFTISLLPMKT